VIELLSSNEVLIANNPWIHIGQLVLIVSNLGTHQSFADSFWALLM